MQWMFYAIRSKIPAPWPGMAFVGPGASTDYEKLKTLLCYRMELLDTYFYGNVEEYLELGYQ